MNHDVSKVILEYGDEYYYEHKQEAFARPKIRLYKFRLRVQLIVCTFPSTTYRRMNPYVTRSFGTITISVFMSIGPADLQEKIKGNLQSALGIVSLELIHRSVMISRNHLSYFWTTTFLQTTRFNSFQLSPYMRIEVSLEHWTIIPLYVKFLCKIPLTLQTLIVT